MTVLYMLAIVALLVGAALLVVGRIQFFRGYASGAPSRAAGFGLTFYPTVALLISVVAVAVLQGSA